MGICPTTGRVLARNAVLLCLDKPRKRLSGRAFALGRGREFVGHPLIAGVSSAPSALSVSASGSFRYAQQVLPIGIGQRRGQCF